MRPVPPPRVLLHKNTKYSVLRVLVGSTSKKDVSKDESRRVLQLDRTTTPRAVSIPPQENRAAEALFFLTRICALYRVFNSSGVNGDVFMFFASLLSSLRFSLYKQPACCVSIHGILKRNMRWRVHTAATQTSQFLLQTWMH